MAHCDAIADRYRIKFERRPACLADCLFDNLSHLIQVNVTRHYLAEAVGNTDERLVYICIAKAAGAEQPSVRRPLKSFFYRIASHLFLPSTTKALKK
jgi:hypothetical protein